MKFKDLTGSIFGRLEVVGIDRKDTNGVYYWNCKCSCGESKSVARTALQQGKTVSCGCFGREQAAKRATTHGKSKSKTYAVWRTMKARVNDPEGHSSEYYFSKGIKLCPEWEIFENFLADMGEAPDGLWLERKDNNGNYCKDNCKWETPSRQCSNRGTNRNKSGRLGIYWAKDRRTWRAEIVVGGKKQYLGGFKEYSEAVSAIESAELTLLGYSRKEGFV
jgi:hypothetical protein